MSATNGQIASHKVRPVYDASGNVVGLRAGGRGVGSVCLVSYANEAGLAALPASAEQLISSVVLIPANTVKAGDKFQFVAFAEDAGTADAVVRAIFVRVHTTPSVLSGALLTTIRSVSAANNKVAVDKTVAVTSNAGVRSTVAGSTGSLLSTTAQTTAAIDWTVDQYLGITVVNSNTLVNFLVYHASVTLEAVQ